jgi:hypothetical protein
MVLCVMTQKSIDTWWIYAPSKRIKSGGERCRLGDQLTISATISDIQDESSNLQIGVTNHCFVLQDFLGSSNELWYSLFVDDHFPKEFDSFGGLFARRFCL